MMKLGLLFAIFLAVCSVQGAKVNESECDLYLADLIQAGNFKRSAATNVQVNENSQDDQALVSLDAKKKKEHFLECLPYLVNVLSKLEAYKVYDEAAELPETTSQDGEEMNRETRRVKAFWKRRAGSVKSFW